MQLLRRLFYFFMPYTDARERAVGRFFKQLTERSNTARARRTLLQLLQQDIAVINLWTEHRYKGYTYLRKSERRRLYQNVQRITEDFARFYAAQQQTPQAVMARIQQQAPRAALDLEKAVLLQALLDYFSPSRGVFEYRESSSFGRLLRDPAQEKLIGDCNQIVTLYLYLYSRYHDVRDLHIRRLPEHVALHCGGVDIETTSGTWANYSEQSDSSLLPIEEIVSINLLDTTDSYLSTHTVAPEDFLQATRLAFLVSSDRDVVRHNLEAAYTKLVNSLMKQHNYAQALTFAQASRNMTLLGVVGHNGALYAIRQHQYGDARRFAQHALDKTTLIQSSWRAEGVYHYRAKRYHDAIKAFTHSGEQKLVQQSYEALFFEEQGRLGSDLTTESIKKHAKTMSRMRDYAKKSGNKKLIEHVRHLRKYL